MFYAKEVRAPETVGNKTSQEKERRVDIAQSGQEKRYVCLDLSDAINPVESLYLCLVRDGASSDRLGYVADVVNIGALKDSKRSSSISEIEGYKKFVGPEMTLYQMKDIMLERHVVGEAAFSVAEISSEEWNHAKMLEDRTLADVRYKNALKHAHAPYEDIRAEEMIKLTSARKSLITQKRSRYEDITNEDMRELDPVRFSEKDILPKKQISNNFTAQAFSNRRG